MHRRSVFRRSTLTAAAVGLALGVSLGAARPGDYSFFDPIIDVKAIIDGRYVEAPDRAALQEGAIRGMVEALGDPYTVYVPPSDRREFDKSLTGDYVGIGVSVDMRDDWLTVITPLEGSPAFKAGVLAGDRIVEIDGTSTFRLPVDRCIDLLSGVPGTTTRIVVERGAERLTLTVPRDRIIARMVKGLHWRPGSAGGNGDGKNGAQGGDGAEGGWEHLIDPSRRIAYLRLAQFTPTSAKEIEETLERLGAAEGGLGGLILDLRWNPGGVLGEAVRIADLFLREGVIVSTKGRAVKEEVSRARAEGTLPDFPIVLLINGQSASASEILAGALVENGRAIAVGTRTFGKGSVQSVIGLPSGGGGQLKITEQRYHLPSGRSIHRTDDSPEWGVDPSEGFYVPMTQEETAAAIRVRNDEDVIRGAGSGGEAGWSDPEWILERLKDKQLAAAVRAMQARLDTGAWTPAGEAPPAGEELALEDLRRSQTLRERLLRELDRVERRIERLEAAAAPEPASAHDLWPDEAPVAGGRLEVFDRDGNPVAKLRITGDRLERWLIDAGVEPAPADDATP